MIRLCSLVFLLAALAGPAPGPDANPSAAPTSQDRLADLARQVADQERAFAKTMADRDHEAFSSFISDEGIFWGQKGVLRGRAQVAAGWKPFFDGPQAPFSWEPERVEVLDSGTLALSSGPVRDPSGKAIGTFNSVWRLESDGRWRVIFDKGCSGQ
jgi:ketosteroid isomerase-like protein